MNFENHKKRLKLWAELKEKDINQLNINKMSKSNPNEQLINPAKKFFEWSGSEGKLKYYDKENKVNVFVELPFTFLVLDKLTTIVGYSDAEQSGIWSNEVRKANDKLVVKTKNGTLIEGIYAEIKDAVKGKGGKYAQSVYIAYYEGRELTLGHLKLSGSAIGSWIEFCKTVNVESNIAVTISGNKPEKKGATKYFVPTFETKSVSDETNNIAISLDLELQAYLKPYLERNNHIPTEVEASVDFVKAVAETKQMTAKANAIAPSTEFENESLPF